MKRIVSFFIGIFILSTGSLTAQQIIVEKKPTRDQRRTFAGSLMILPDNSHLVSYDRTGNKIMIRNLETGGRDSIELQFKREHSNIQDIVATHNSSKIIIEITSRYSPKKNRSILGGGGDSIWKWETTLLCYSLPGKELLWEFTVPDLTNYEALLVSPDDRTLGGIAQTGSDKFLDLETGKKAAAGPGFSNGEGRNILQSADGRLVLFWARPGFKTFNTRTGSRLDLWDFDKKKIIASKFIRGKGVWAAAFGKDEGSVFLGCYDGSLQEWTLSDDHLTLQYKSAGPIGWLSYPASADRALAVNLSRTDSLSIYSCPDMKPLVAFLLSGDDFIVGGGSTPRFVFSNDGRYFAIYHQDGSLSVYRTDNWQLINLLLEPSL